VNFLVFLRDFWLQMRCENPFGDNTLCLKISSFSLFSSLFIFLLPFITLLEDPSKTVSVLFLITASQIGLFCFIFISLFPIINAKAKLRHLYHGCSYLVVGAFLFHFVAIMYGAPFLEDFQRTFMWSALMSSLTFLPVCTCCLPSSPIEALRIFLLRTKEDSFEGGAGSGWKLHLYRHCWSVSGLISIAGAWFGALPMPLDWDRPWQVWPVSCTYGCLIGNLLGHFIVFCYNFVNFLHPKKYL